jgi:hypothetical protein
MSSFRGSAVLWVAAIFLAGCSDSSAAAGGDAAAESSATAADTGMAVSDSGAPAADSGDAQAPDPFTGNCSTARWSDVSDTCWSCLCTTCESALNACNLACVKGIACASENHTQVGVSADIPCEERAFTAECLTDPAIKAVVGPLVTFDTCLINMHKPPQMLRACEQECGFVYTNDVCERFPAPDAGATAAPDAGPGAADAAPDSP